MKLSFNQPDQIVLVAESDAEQEMLARAVELRARVVWKAKAWQFSGDRTFPQKRVSRLDLGMADNNAPIQDRQ